MSGGFGFGMQNTTANTGTTFSFGSNPTTTTAGLTFGPPATGTTAGFQFSSPGQTTGGLSFGTPQTSTTASTGGFAFGRSTQQQAGGLSFGAPQATATVTPTFKPTMTSLSGGAQQIVPLSFGPTMAQTTLSFGATTPQTTVSFGTTVPQTTLSFGATTPQTTGLSFASTTPQTTGLSFAPTTPQTTGLSFGSTPQTTVATFGATPQIATVPAFSSTPLTAGAATTTAAAPLTFSSTPQTTGLSFASTTPQTTGLSFASTTPQTTGLSFGSSAPLTFGASSTTAQTTPLASQTTQAKPTALTFGTPVATAGSTTTATTGLTFGGTPITLSSTTTPKTSLFSTPTQQISASPFSTIATATTTATKAIASTPGKDTFTLGQSKDAAPKPTFAFGMPTAGATPSVTTAATAVATTSAAVPATTGLFSFSIPKTTTTTASIGFALPSTNLGGSGSLFTSFAAATTSAAATTTTTTAATPFKGLGGVDTTASLPGILGGTTGRSDIKSVKENAVPNEIMQTIDTFKAFVKQHKNLACEITRTSGKPMNKVTEDSDALKQILTTVQSALQKNRQISNKLKADTTKCLLLCEMAQHTHDTPVGLQNENVAPLEYFLQLATKFEKDVANLRMEIDNTEKHVNSLSQPAVLTPQELSVALRRLHDSFVALAGQLQTAHAAVAIQKERHLNLRRQFLKDNTNIFEPDDNKSLSYMKNFKMPVTLSAGPTPFSSMGNMQSISMLASQDKSGPIFPTTSTTLSSWGTPSAPTGTSLLQTTGSTSLFSPQPVENQNFQLLKPPPGNKRGKR